MIGPRQHLPLEIGRPAGVTAIITEPHGRIKGNKVSRDRDTENVTKCEWPLLADNRPSAYS
jgi:hypothetical protein